MMSFNHRERGDHSNVPAKLEELNKTYGTPNLISQAESFPKSGERIGILKLRKWQHHF